MTTVYSIATRIPNEPIFEGIPGTLFLGSVFTLRTSVSSVVNFFEAEPGNLQPPSEKGGLGGF